MATQQSIPKGLSSANITTESRPCSFNRIVASDPIQMEIVFGRPSKDCEDIGICRINLVTDLPQASKQPCDCAKKTMAYVQQQRNGQLLFRFSKNQINPETIITQFVDQQFTVPEAYILPEPLQRLFCPRILIEAGCYPIIETEFEWRVTL